MDYKAKYEEALKTAKFFADNTDDEICKKKIEEIFPELAESEDEKIRKDIIHFIKGFGLISKKKEKSWLAWLEKQGGKTNPYSGFYFEYNGHVWGMCARDGGVEITLDKKLFRHLGAKQGESILNEEDRNRFAKGVLSDCAISFINYLDANKYKGKMCVSNMECEDIENAFHNAMWGILHRYYCNYIEKPSEQKSAWSEEDEERYLSCLQRLGTGNLEQPETINIVWLKSLKDRITLTNNDDFDKGYDLGISVAKLDQWKPTEEQFKALEMEIYDSGQYLEVRKTLESLYNDLKKL